MNRRRTRDFFRHVPLAFYGNKAHLRFISGFAPDSDLAPKLGHRIESAAAHSRQTCHSRAGMSQRNANVNDLIVARALPGL